MFFSSPTRTPIHAVETLRVTVTFVLTFPWTHAAFAIENAHKDADKDTQSTIGQLELPGNAASVRKCVE
jgi:hypothetical protein